MSHYASIRWSPLVLALTMAATGSAGSGEPGYSVSLLPSLGEPGGEAHAINESGQVAGSSFTEFISCGGGLLCSYVHAVLWRDGEVLDLHSFSDSNISTALGMNNLGQVVGQVIRGGVWDGWLWDEETMTILPSLAGRDTLAMDVNERGLIAGWSDTPDDLHRAVMWQDGKLVELGTYDGGTVSYAEGLNRVGAVVGTATTDKDLTYTKRATLWEGGRMIMLDTRPDEVTQSIARAINDHRQIVGEAFDAAVGGNVAHLWEENGATGAWEMTNMGSTTAGTRSRAYDVNVHGQVVGQAECFGGCGRAFIWQDGVMDDLNNLIPAGSGWTLRIARSINDAGQIVGVGVAPEGGTRSFLLDPIAGTCVGDIDGDGVVGDIDFLMLLGAWGPCANCGDCPAEQDGDCIVGINDFLALLANWGLCP